MTGKPKYYWDACIFLALLKNEQRKDPSTLLAIGELARLSDEGKLTIVTSVITRTEVLQSSLTKEANTQFRAILDTGLVLEYVVDQRVANLAHDIRDRYLTRAVPVKIKTPDAIHVATAIVAGVDELHTLDGEGASRPSNLTRLNEDAEVKKLKIVVPGAATLKMPLLEGIGTIAVNAPHPVVPKSDAAEEPAREPEQTVPEIAAPTVSPRTAEPPGLPTATPTVEPPALPASPTSESAAPAPPSGPPGGTGAATVPPAEPTTAKPEGDGEPGGCGPAPS